MGLQHGGGIISIHAPREGSDCARRQGFICGPEISIHAPREGSDPGSASSRWPPGHFYPRSPRGERQIVYVDYVQIIAISIHAPREGSDSATASHWAPMSHISIHAPREGSDKLGGVLGQVVDVFLSTLPARGATHHRQRDPPGPDISIHAPREGSDGKQVLGFRYQSISIHAPREGSDAPGCPVQTSIFAFLSTLPARGATWRRWPVDWRVLDFYPRSPRGERPPVDTAKRYA